ncbi:unnamed protein product, partial [Vitis vinifera]|uniref:Uncharacterized protein n=1 Tax=Vitis vinifera TaxID=29760 RepID=D7TSJ2_VITVI
MHLCLRFLNLSIKHITELPNGFQILNMFWQFFLKQISFSAIFLLLPTKTPIRAALPSFPFLTYIYHPSRPKFVSKKENSPIFLLLLFSFFKSSNQKQSSQFQIPLQNLPRRVPPSLNSNGKFPCKNMKFLKLNNCMNR